MVLFVLSLCPFDFSLGVGAFVIGLGQISSFLSERNEYYIAVCVFALFRACVSVWMFTYEVLYCYPGSNPAGSWPMAVFVPCVSLNHI